MTSFAIINPKIAVIVGKDPIVLRMRPFSVTASSVSNRAVSGMSGTSVDETQLIFEISTFRRFKRLRTN